jgi:hypothetical protein
VRPRWHLDGERDTPKLPTTEAMNPATPDAVPRRWRRLRRMAIVTIAVLMAMAIGVWRCSWWAPPIYAGGSKRVVQGRALDSAGHDARVTLLDEGPYVLHIQTDVAREIGEARRGSLLFFGSRHSKDPGHPQLAELRRAWEGFAPTVALVEGRMGFFVGSASQGIGVFGEGAAAYCLAERSGIPVYTLEPPLDLEIAALEEIGDRTQVALFRTLSGYISARRGGPVSDFKINRLLSKRAAPLTDALPSIAALDAYFAAQFPDLPGWRELPEEAMWPGRTDTWLNLMATRSNIVRDEHFVRTMLDLVNRGERVLAIAGRSHTIVLEPVLWESMQPAVRGEFSSSRPWEARAD